MNNEVSEYVEPIFRFCLKRLASRTDAEDLSQEILLCVLQAIKRGGIVNLDGYVWRVAHNRYARLVQTRNGDPTILYGHEHYHDIPDTEADTETVEIHQSLFNALHTLSSMYRNIMVDYYVHRLDTYMIARKHSVSVETVKWRLHAGREKIRERMTHMEKNYEHVKMHVMFNGRSGPNPNQYLVLQLQKAIAKVCYASPLTLEEISLATGTPTLYLSDVIQNMIWGGTIEQTGNRYATNFIITPTGKEMDAFLSDIVLREATARILEYIQATETQVRGIGFYGKDFPASQLFHIMVPAIVYQFSNNNSQQPFPPHRNGNAGWYIVHEGIEGTLDWRFSDMLGYQYGENIRPGHRGVRFNHWWVGGTSDRELDTLLRGNARFYISAIGKDYSLTFANEEEAAKALSFNLCKKHNGRIMPSILIFTEEEYGQLLAWARKCEGFEPIWHIWVGALQKAYKQFTPKRLVDQIEGNINYQAFNLYPRVIKELQNRELASMANSSEIFIHNLFLVR